MDCIPEALVDEAAAAAASSCLNNSFICSSVFPRALRCSDEAVDIIPQVLEVEGDLAMASRLEKKLS